MKQSRFLLSCNERFVRMKSVGPFVLLVLLVIGPFEDEDENEDDQDELLSSNCYRTLDVDRDTMAA